MKYPFQTILLTSLVSLSFAQFLSADSISVNVNTADNATTGTSVVTLSDAITQVNANSLDGGTIIIGTSTNQVSPYASSTSPFNIITSPCAIQSYASGSPVTINAANTSQGISFTPTLPTSPPPLTPYYLKFALTSDVILENAIVNIDGSNLSGGYFASAIFQGTNNWIGSEGSPGITGINLTQGQLNISFSETSAQEYTGPLSITNGSIFLQTTTQAFSNPPVAVLTLSGTITGSNITFAGNAEIILNNTSSTNSWTGSTTITLSEEEPAGLTVLTSSSLPALPTFISANARLTFKLDSSDTYTSSQTITGSGSFAQLNIEGGTINLSGAIASIDPLIITEGTLNASSSVAASNIFVLGGTCNLSGPLTNTSLTITGGTTTLSGNSAASTNTTTLGATPSGNESVPGNLYISSIDNIGSGSFYFAGGTLFSTGDVSFFSSQTVTLTGSSTINTNSGYTTTILSLYIDLVSYIETSFITPSSATLTLNGPGAYTISAIDFSTQNQDNLQTTGARTLVIDGILGGTSNLSITGNSLGATLSLSSINTYVGTTTIGEASPASNVTTSVTIESSGQTGTSTNPIVVNSQATLNVNGTILADILTIEAGGSIYESSSGTITAGTINNYGTLQGCGTTSGTVMNNAITIAGCSFTTLTILGDFRSTEGSSISVFIGPTDSSNFFYFWQCNFRI